jgi:flagellar motor switch protein FliG
MSSLPAGSPGISGVRKAAVLLTLLGEEAAALVYRHLSRSDVQAITTELAILDAVPPDVAEQILQEYQQLATTQRFVPQGGVEYATRVLQKAFGEDSAKPLVQSAAEARNSGASKLAWLRDTDPQQLSAFLEKEHPQTIALVLAHLEAKHASSILTKLSAPTRIEAVKRLAQLRQFSPEVAETISNILNQRLKPAGEQKRQSLPRSAGVSELMNHLEPTTARAILESIEQENADLANEIRNMMFTFEDFLGVPEPGLREWIGTLDKKTLAMALKGASEPVREHIFKTMSSRAVEMMKEDMDVLGRVRARDVTKAQQEAVIAARQLEAEGKITLRAEGDDEYIA